MKNVCRMLVVLLLLQLCMAFIGHDVCRYDGLYCTRTYNDPNSVKGVTFPALGVAAITNDTSVEDEIKTAIHEFGHLFFALDHYGGIFPSTGDMNQDPQYNGSEFLQDCIYGENRENDEVEENRIICEGCKQIIRDYLRTINHD